MSLERVEELFNWAGWLESLIPSTRKQFQYYVQRYLDWLRGEGLFLSGDALLRDYDGLKGRQRARHLELLKRWLRAMGGSRKTREVAFYAVKNFYSYHQLFLPPLTRSEKKMVFRASETDKQRKMAHSVIRREELRNVLLECIQPYRSILLIMFQGGIGQAEFNYFNLQGWRNVVPHLQGEKPVRVDLYRQKISAEDVHKYYTFLGSDAKEAILRWLPQRARILKRAGSVKTKASEALFLTYSKGDDQVTVPNKDTIWHAMRAAAIRINLTTSTYNKFKPHNLRHAFRSICTISGVKKTASEYFLGHKIDYYDESPELNPEWFQKEYMKAEPALNIFSNPGEQQRINQQDATIQRMQTDLEELKDLKRFMQWLPEKKWREFRSEMLKYGGERASADRR